MTMPLRSASLPEPSVEKVEKLIARLHGAGIKIREKDLRGIKSAIPRRQI